MPKLLKFVRGCQLWPQGWIAAGQVCEVDDDTAKHVFDNYPDLALLTTAEDAAAELAAQEPAPVIEGVDTAPLVQAPVISTTDPTTVAPAATEPAAPPAAAPPAAASNKFAAPQKGGK